MKLRISSSKQLQYLAYYEYSQRCIKSNPMEIPDLFENWIKKQTNETIMLLLEGYVE